MILASFWYNVGSVFTKLIISIYRTVVKVFNLMNSFVDGINEDAESMLLLDGVTDSLYILIAIFMLFRITISLLEYLIDPDKASDKGTGAGKLVTRIVISLILLVAFPTIIGGVHHFEDSLLSEGSILYSLFQPESTGTGSSETQIGTCDLTKETITTIEELSAAAMYCDYNQNLHNQIEQIAKKLYPNALVNVNDTIFNKDKAKMVKKITYTSMSNSEYVWTSETVNIKLAVAEGKSYAELTETEGNDFAKNVIASFSNKPEDITEKEILTDVQAERKLIKAVEQDNIELDVFLCLITGVILIIFILILCIEVVIRGLKLTVLEIFAPIAIVSYMNPNDKILNNWFQKYLGCYLDLFIKIIAIRAGVFLIGNISITNNEKYGAIGTILLYMGIFIFVKTIPNLVSDVLGIKNMGGTFKESMNALKTAAGIGAGAIAGGVAGFASGFGKGGGFTRVAGGLLGGTFRGAQGGAKGKIFQGASTQIKRNSVAKNLSAQGVGWFDRMGGRTGLNDKKSLERQISKYKEEASNQGKMTTYADKAEETAKKIMKKGKMDKVPGRASKYQNEINKLENLTAAAATISEESIASNFNKENYVENGVFNKQKYDRDIKNATQIAKSNANSAIKGQSKYIHASGADVKNAKRDLEELNNKRNSITKESVEKTMDRDLYMRDGKFMQEKFEMDRDNKYELLKRNADEEYNAQKFFVEALDNERDLAESELRQLTEKREAMKNNSNTKQENIDKINAEIGKYTRYVNSLDYEHLDEKQINSFEDDAVSQTYNESTDAEIATLKQTADIELGEFDVNNATGFLEVKAKGKAAKARKDVATSNANAIENSEHFRNVKNAESLGNGK